MVLVLQVFGCKRSLNSFSCNPNSFSFKESPPNGGDFFVVFSVITYNFKEAMKLEKGASIKDIISFQVHRNIINLYKRYFEITEDLLREHKAFLSKLQNETLDNIDIESVDYFTDEKYDHIRKRILDSGNDCVREIEKALEFVEVTLKEDE